MALVRELGPHSKSRSYLLITVATKQRSMLIDCCQLLDWLVFTSPHGCYVGQAFPCRNHAIPSESIIYANKYKYKR